MKSKINILIFIDWFYPAFKAGGPIKSIFNLTQALGDELNIFILTSDKDVDGTKLNVSVNEIIKNNGYDIIYLDSEHQNSKQYKELADSFKPDFIYYNSLFSVKYTLLPYFVFRNRESVTNILAPRGMLGKGALSIKPFKKKLFIWVTRSFLFKKRLIWHASTESEEQEIINNYGQNSTIRIAQNISGAINKRNQDSITKRKEQLNVVFLSRISSKKNLMFLLKLVSEMKDLEGIKLSIYGPVEKDLNWPSHMEVISNDERIEYLGLVSPEEISLRLQNNHLYVLPSLNENYGHSIVEALLSGVPVLISDQTPWRNINQYNIGHDLALNDINGWKNAIRAYYGMEEQAYKNCVESCYSYARENILNPEILEENSKLFQLI